MRAVHEIREGDFGVGFMTPFVVAIAAYTFFGLADNHLPLDAICREIEVSVLDTLGVRELPARLEPVGGRLS